MNLEYCAVGTVMLTVLTMILYHVIKNDWTFNRNIWKEILISLILSAAVITIMSAVILFKDTKSDGSDQKAVNIQVENIIEENSKPVISSPESKKTDESEEIDSKAAPDNEENTEDEDVKDSEEDTKDEDTADSNETTLVDVTYGDTTVVVPEINVDVNSADYAYHDFIGTDSILPESSIREYDISELQNLSAKACVLARNEIYARHGRIFTNEDLMAYFSSKSWYTPTIPADEFSNSVLTKTEKHNKDLIVSYEQQMGYK